MLRILGSPRRVCDGMTRREMLRIGGLGAFSLGLAAPLGIKPLAAGDRPPSPSFGRAKRVIVLYLYGAAAQHETFDPKPGAPLEVRGIFKPTSTSVPGVQICELLPNVAKIMDRVSVIRSMNHLFPIHSAAYTLTGIDRVDVPMELNPYDSRHWPFFGSVLDYLAQRGERDHPPPDIPRNIALPFRFSSRCPEAHRGGPYGGFLGRPFDPVCTEFEGRATKSVLRYRDLCDQAVPDPYLGITPESRLTLSDATTLAADMTLDRLDRRRTLLEQLDDARRKADRSADTRSLDRFREMAYRLMSSQKIRGALDLSKEPMSLRKRYGMTLFGQSTLAGRRLLEAGATTVTVTWDEVQTVNSSWDTHFSHFERLKDELLPGLDRALSALVLDLEERGMLDDTLVMCLTEHGRTPKLVNTERGACRDHWSSAYCGLLAGGGIARGTVVGASDNQGAYVKEDPVSPKDVLATMYHLMGIDHRMTIKDRLNRPFPLVADGEVIRGILG